MRHDHTSMGKPTEMHDDNYVGIRKEHGENKPVAPASDISYHLDILYNEVQQVSEDVNRLGARLLPITRQENTDSEGPAVYPSNNIDSPISLRMREVLNNILLIRRHIDDIQGNLDLP